MKRRYIALLGAVWLILIGLLVGYGLTGGQSEPAKYGREDVLVSVTGSGATADTSRTTEAGTSEPGITSETPSEAPEETSKTGLTQKPADSQNEATPRPSGSSKPTTTQEAGTPKATTGTSKQATPRATRTPKPSEAPKKATCHFTIECKRILLQRDLWRDGLEEVIPGDGILFAGEIPIRDGETVYDALKEICEKKDILLDSRYTPLYDTYYVSGIGNLYEFDCGSESGWKYSVNGTLPGVGCSRYELHKGDTVVFFYDYEI